MRSSDAFFLSYSTLTSMFACCIGGAFTPSMGGQKAQRRPGGQRGACMLECNRVIGEHGLHGYQL